MYFSRTGNTWLLEKEPQVQRAQEGSVSDVFLARHGVQCGCGAGTGETEAENRVREVAGHPGRGFAGPWKDKECYLERWLPLPRGVTCSDVQFQSSLYGVTDCRRLQWGQEACCEVSS